jgi:outer membrane protein TolC
MPIGKWVLLALAALVLQPIGYTKEGGSIDAGGHKGPPALLVPHVDELVYDSNLTLGEVIEATLAEFPRTFLAQAFAEEASAWRRRANSLLPGPVALAGNYSGDRIGDNTGNWAIDTELVFPLWKWGQQATAERVTEKASRHVEAYQQGLRLEVAGLVREALWDLKLKEVEYATAREILALSERLLSQVRRRVEVGDLPRTDLLLAETDFLKARAEAVAAEAEWMHARQRYRNLTRMDKVPTNFEERLKPKPAISPEHPLLLALTSRIEQEKARMQYTRFEADVGDQQILFTVGSHHEHVARGGESLNSINARLSIPIGGGAYQAPNVAAVRTALAEIEAQRGEVYRQLERELHEAEHLLQVDQVQLEQAEGRRKLAQANLELSRKAFDAGEMDLIDLLKVQMMAQEALRDAERWRVQVKRDIARYNQIVGELP